MAITKYPSAIDDNTSLPDAIDNATPVEAAVVNRLKKAILALENELGIKPSGVYSTVKARLDNLELNGGGGGGGGSVSFSGDLSGNNSSQTVIGLQNRPIVSTAPLNAQLLGWNGSAWAPVNRGASIENTSQSTWYVNAVSGDDTNDGLTSGTPIKTFAEFARRLGAFNTLTPPSNPDAFPYSDGAPYNFGPIPANIVDIYLQTDIPADDVFNLLAILNPDVYVVVHGIATTVRSGSITAITNLDQDTNQQWEITDTGISGTWTDDLHQRLRIVGGPNDGAIAWVAKDLGSKTARISEFNIGYLPPAIGLYSGNLNPSVSPQIGDNYVVETLTNMQIGYLNLPTPTFISLSPAIAFIDLNISGAQIFSLQGGSQGYSTFYNCKFTTAIGNLTQAHDYINCCFTAGLLITNGGVFNIHSGLVIGSLDASNTIMTVRGNTLIQGNIQIGGGGNIGLGGVGIFESSTHGIIAGITAQAQSGGVLTITPLGHLAGDKVYGKDNIGYGIFITGLFQVDLHSSSLFGSSEIPSLTGDLGDFNMDGATQGFAFDPTGAFATPIGPLAFNWTNVAASQPTGFGGNAHNLATGAEITTTSDTGSLGPGANIGMFNPINNIILSAGIFSTASASFTRVGSREIDMSQFPDNIGILTRHVAFKADIDQTAGAISVEVKLVDITNNVDITSSDLTSSSTSNTEVSATLTVGTIDGTIRTDVNAVYEINIRMNGGSLSDQVFITNARIEISYS